MKTLENTDNAYQESIDLSNENEVLFDERNHEALEEKHANEAVKGAAWLLGIVAVFALGILLTWIVGSRSPFLTRSLEREAVAWHQSKPIKAQLTKTSANASSQFVASLTSVNSPGSTAQKEVSKETAPVIASGSNVSSAVDMDRIEREAREVIHGDYGVNPDRKAKLGADYAAVQARVNELLHK